MKTTGHGLIIEEGRTKILPLAQLEIPVYGDLGFQRGDAVFETILARGSNLFHIEDHAKRLTDSCAQVAIPVTIDAQRIVEEALSLARENVSLFSQSTLRIIVSTCTDDGLPISGSSRVTMFQYPFRDYPR